MDIPHTILDDIRDKQLSLYDPVQQTADHRLSNQVSNSESVHRRDQDNIVIDKEMRKREMVEFQNTIKRCVYIKIRYSKNTRAHQVKCNF